MQLPIVSSSEPLEKVGYFRRGDGMADIRLRRNIRTIEHEATSDGMPAWTEYQAEEAYLLRDLTEQEAVEQYDTLWRSYITEHKDADERIAELEQVGADNADSIAELYEQLATITGGENA